MQTSRLLLTYGLVTIRYSTFLLLIGLYHSAAGSKAALHSTFFLFCRLPCDDFTWASPVETTLRKPECRLRRAEIYHDRLFWDLICDVERLAPWPFQAVDGRLLPGLMPQIKTKRLYRLSLTLRSLRSEASI